MAENHYAREEVAYCGDDLNDLAAMALCGFVACPADAAAEVKARAVTSAPSAAAARVPCAVPWRRFWRGRTMEGRREKGV